MTPYIIIGIFSGLIAAFFQSVSYVFSRRFVLKYENSTIRLLLTSHIWMGIMSLFVFIFLPLKNVPPFTNFGVYLIAASIFYVLGQIGLFMMMKHIQASRIAPLLGLKILILAIITTFFIGEKLSLIQWIAVFLSIIAAFLLNFAGIMLSLETTTWLLIACTGYSLSDLNIAMLVQNIKTLPFFSAAMIAVAMSYTFCGIIAAVVLISTDKYGKPKEWKDSFPFAFFWFMSMIALFTCFGLIGALFGNIIQSTRGIMSIIIGVILARSGYLHIEEKISSRLLFRRILAALLMVCAIALFNYHTYK